MFKVISLSLFLLLIGCEKESHVYPCSLAEISPDIPLEVKQKCRQLQKQPVMKDGCVYQESQGRTVKTCG
jgi:hypothetical protein